MIGYRLETILDVEGQGGGGASWNLDKFNWTLNVYFPLFFLILLQSLLAIELNFIILLVS